MHTREILDQAAELTAGDRQQAYGSPEVNFGRIADLWNAYLDGIGHRELTEADVALLNALQKVARLEETPHHADSWVDIAGYAATGGGVVTERPSPATVPDPAPGPARPTKRGGKVIKIDGR